jgi:hypothetical protein
VLLDLYPIFLLHALLLPLNLHRLSQLREGAGRVRRGVPCGTASPGGDAAARAQRAVMREARVEARVSEGSSPNTAR